MASLNEVETPVGLAVDYGLPRVPAYTTLVVRLTDYIVSHGYILRHALQAEPLDAMRLGGFRLSAA